MQINFRFKSDSSSGERQWIYRQAWYFGFRKKAKRDLDGLVTFIPREEGLSDRSHEVVPLPGRFVKLASSSPACLACTHVE